MKTAVVLKQVVDRKKVVNEKNTSTVLDKTADDIQEARDDNACDDAEEEDDDEEEHGEGLLDTTLIDVMWAKQAP